MRDIQGRTWLERRKERSFEKADSRSQAVKDAISSASETSIAGLRRFLSLTSLVRSVSPQIALGVIILLVEYRLIGAPFTVGSVVVYLPVMYLYSRSLRTRHGVFLMVPSSNFMDWERMFVSDEIWSLVRKDSGLTLESGKINGRITYWCTEVKYLEGTSVPYYAQIAWAHYNRSKYAMFASVLDDLTTMLKDTLLEVAKLKVTRGVDSISEGTRQTGEYIHAISSAYRDNILTTLKKQTMRSTEAEAYERNVYELLNDPEFLRVITAKRAEAEKLRAEKGT